MVTLPLSRLTIRYVYHNDQQCQRNLKTYHRLNHILIRVSEVIQPMYRIVYSQLICSYYQKNVFVGSKYPEQRLV